MNPFVAWAVSWQGTAALMSCALVCGMILGWLACGQHHVRQERRMRTVMRQRREANRAAAQFRAMRLELHHEPDPEAAERREAMARRTHPVSRELRPASMLQPCTFNDDGVVALVRDDLTDSAYTADMAARMDRFLEELCGVPYSADELWSGQ